MARKLKISTILAYAESVQDQRYICKMRKQEKVLFLTRDIDEVHADIRESAEVIILPYQDLSRSEQFQLGLLLATLNNQVAIDETVLCMTGLVGSLRLDNLLITNLQRDNRWFRSNVFEDIPQDLLRSPAFIRLLDVALRLAREGREGKKIGTMFVLGDSAIYENFLQQMVLNPFDGHPERFRNIHNESFFETLREFSVLDGAFVVRDTGVVERAGVYIQPPEGKKTKMQRGLGARHASAAAFTSAVDSLVITVSESSSTVTVFSKGAMILNLKP